jgi:hypothetical protein
MTSSTTNQYDDAYETCERTYVTLRIYDVVAERVTALLGLEPTRTQTKGAKKYPKKADSILFRRHGWFLSSDRLASRDSRRHLDWLLDQVEPTHDQLQSLRVSGTQMDISCYWLSAYGHGGPTISPAQAGRVARLGLELWFDVYVGDIPAAQEHAGPKRGPDAA